jgi:hypothetical protein
MWGTPGMPFGKYPLAAPMSRPAQSPAKDCRGGGAPVNGPVKL